MCDRGARWGVVETSGYEKECGWCPGLTMRSGGTCIRWGLWGPSLKPCRAARRLCIACHSWRTGSGTRSSSAAPGCCSGPASPRRRTATTRSTNFRIDSRLGDDADFQRLVAAAHSRGLRILLDGVFNHVGRSFQGPAEWFSDRVFEGHEILAVLDHDEPGVQQHV